MQPNQYLYLNEEAMRPFTYSLDGDDGFPAALISPAARYLRSTISAVGPCHSTISAVGPCHDQCAPFTVDCRYPVTPMSLATQYYTIQSAP